MDSAGDVSTPMHIWDEPVRGRSAAFEFAQVPGLDVLRLAIEMQLPAPPIHYLTGLRPTEAGVGRATFAMPATDWLQNPAGLFPGGVFALVADAPFSAAVSSGLPPGKAVTTSELSMSYLRPASPRSGTLIARGASLHSGRSMGLSEVRIHDAKDRALAHGTSRLVVLDVPVDTSAPIPGPEEPITDPADPYLRPAHGTVHEPDVLDAVSGLELIQQFIAGTIAPPPIAHLIDSGPVSAADGEITWRMATSPWLSSPAPMLYGGALALLADVALGGAVSTTLPAGTTFATLDLKVQFIRPVFPGTGDVLALGRVIHRGRTIALANAELRSADGKVVAFATGSSMILPGGVRQLVGGDPEPPVPA